MNTTHTVSLAVSAFLLLTPGCILEDPGITDGPFTPFPCSSNEDCADGYYCPGGTCIANGVFIDFVCDDEDGDDYGVGEDRTECRFPEEDTDDTDAAIFPGADDICDGNDNDSDGEVDEPLECESIADCPRENLPDASFFRCIANTCVLKPSNTTPLGCDVELSCVDGAYEDVPETCR